MKKLFLLPVILLFTAATYGPPFSVSDFSSLTNRPNPSSVNPVGVVLGKTNAYDGNGGIFVFTPSSTNAVDGDIYLTTTTTGRWVRLTRDLATISSPLVLSNGTLSLAALTNYFTFLAGTNMQVTVTSNTVTYAMTNTTGGGSAITVNGGLVTNFWDNGYITFLNAGGGDYSLNIGDDTISTNKINSTFYNWVLSLSGGGGGTTNGLGVNGTFRTDWNAINSAEIAYTVSAGTNWYGSLVAGSVAANKLATTGTGTSTNFLAGDYSYKQVTTNMIPGLNAILATIGSGGGSGGGIGTNFILNGVMKQPAIITNGLSVIWSTNANGHVQAEVSLVETNIPSTIARLDSPAFNGTVTFDTLVANTLQFPFANSIVYADSSSNAAPVTIGTNLTFVGGVLSGTGGGGGGSGGLGTNLFVNNILSQPAKLTNSTTIVWSTNSNGDIVATATNIAGTTTDNVLQWLGSAYFIVTNNSTIGDFSVLQTNGIVYNAAVIGAGENDAPLGVELSFPTRSTNYIWTFRPEGDVNGFVAYEAEGYRTNTSIRFKLHEAVGSTFFTGGYWMRFDLYDKASVGGSGSGGGGDVYSSSNNVFTGSNTFSGTTTFNNLAIGTVTVVTNLTVPNNAYGAGWNGSTNVPNENSVYDEMELRAPKASPSFTGAATNTGSFGAPTLYVGSTNVAVALASVGGSGLTNGGTIASGTITNLTSQSISIGGETRTNWPGYSLRFDEQYTGFANGFNAVASANPFTGNSYITATATYLPSEMNHNGIVRLATGATANSLYYFLGAYGPSADGVAISGGEAFETVFRVVSTNGLRISFGFHDNSTVAYAGTDVVSIRTGRNSGEWNVLEGVCRFNSTETATSTSYSIQTNVWYIASGYIATNLSTANFSLRLFSDNSVLWTNSVSTNIPNGNTRLTAGLFGASSTNGSTTLIDLDSIYLRLRGQ